MLYCSDIINFVLRFVWFQEFVYNLVKLEAIVYLLRNNKIAVMMEIPTWNKGCVTEIISAEMSEFNSTINSCTLNLKITN